VKILSPLPLGSKVARNRIIFGQHETNLGRGRSLSERHVAYYQRRAAAGVGVIVCEEASVHPWDWPYERAPLWSECREGWAEIASACHSEGSLVLAAVGHAGGQGTSHWSQRELWAPSRVPEVNTREVPKWMEADDIAAVIAGFSDATRAAIASGCDGVEINAGQFSLIRQFLSGLTNQRDDEWGDRPAFARAVIAAVRAAAGPDAVVSLRLSCDELAPWAGITPDMATELVVELIGSGDAPLDASQLANNLDAAPLVDAVTVVRGSIYSISATRPDGHTEPGFNLGLVEQIRHAVRAVHGDRVQVIAQGSIVDIGQAEWAIGEADRCDAVEMTRALIADAELVAKAVSGAVDQIRPCILCNQTCQVRDNRNPPLTCVVDPRSGHERSEIDPPATSKKSIAVLGGGVAGMAAAVFAAERGHDVVLFERTDKLGGATRVAAEGSGRQRFGLIVDWLQAELRRLRVLIECGVDVDTSIAAGGASADFDVDAVVVATGSLDGDRAYSTTRSAVVISARQALAGEFLIDGPVLIWDPIGGPIGVSIAERLAHEGHMVSLATQDNIVGNELSRSGDLAPANSRLAQAGVVMHRRSLLRAVKKGSAELEDRFSGERQSIVASVVIDAGHRLPDESTYKLLAESKVAQAGVTAPNTLNATGMKSNTLNANTVVVRVGDCVAPRTIAEAFIEARRAVLAIEGHGVVSDGVPLGDLGGH